MHFGPERLGDRNGKHCARRKGTRLIQEPQETLQGTISTWTTCDSLDIFFKLVVAIDDTFAFPIPYSSPKTRSFPDSFVSSLT